MGSKWRRAKVALGVNLCLYVPKTLEESRTSDDAVSLSPVTVPRPTTPVPSSSGLRLPRSFSKSSSKKTCAICLTAMKAGQGHAIFTAECSHSFHFHCITTNVKHGNQICPVCRAKWNEVPLQSTNPKSKSPVASRPRDDAWMMTIPPPRRSSQNQPSSRPERLRPVSSIFNTEPAVFNDDDSLEHQNLPAADESAALEKSKPVGVTGKKLQVKTYPEVSEVLRSVSFKDFAVLINLKAPSAASKSSSTSSSSSSSCRAPVDLVTVLDVSGSMAGTKLALLKRAMGFVIQNLGPFDRLSVISFSSTARRNFPLRLMNETGKQEALQAVNSLVSNGGTNIAEGLKKGAKVLIDRRFKNSVSSIVLLSDGQDTYTMTSPTNGGGGRTDYKTLLPKENRIPVHAFGFGADHDASLMHSIAENSGGTFSFIESETVIQDAFAQCIGGLLSVMVQELCVRVECVHPLLKIGSVKAGSYRFDTGKDSRTGSIGVGDLYAEEERNFLVNLDVPVVNGVSDHMSLIKVRCVYRDPVTKETVDLNTFGEVKILRPVVMSEGGRSVVSVEVDRQRIRLRAAEAISEARVLAERGELTEAVSVLETCRGVLSGTVSGRAGDPLCVSLCAELKETQERMASRRVYETSGRAYVLAGLSSHSWQRATARGDMSDATTMSYQTQSMVDMVNLSQTMNFGCPLASSKANSSSCPNANPPAARRKLRQALTFPARPRPR
ncbi:Zinc finger (C3HC4-type RING finger) family protein [Raphanus sativus]|uniref:E3 ubiquitin-protein ligase WAV3 n=1 Tax=Raphanus sativus TaxID=3726 RepID=A0A6J0MGA6_RAPSA|nr:E3 ubiquitin-protein ligase WAV3 [Raphanus sativus]KAJ4910965.1 Zinc finger (C3HC4-type RING finger) family protein [Raphanus sativus]